MTILARRLKNSPKGQPYAVEVVECADLVEAETQATTWWQSAGTAAVLVTDGEREDSRYERAWIERPRIPEDWVDRKKAQLERLAEHKPLIPPGPVVETKGPTLFDEEAPSETVEEAPRKASLTDLCPCCGALREPHDGDDDRTPSGRLANRRCMACGSFQRGLNHNAIMNQYAVFQRRITRVKRQLPSPYK